MSIQNAYFRFIINRQHCETFFFFSVVFYFFSKRRENTKILSAARSRLDHAFLGRMSISLSFPGYAFAGPVIILILL